MAPPSGCVFRTRCPLATDACAQAVPAMTAASDGHSFACIQPTIQAPTHASDVGQ